MLFQGFMNQLALSALQTGKYDTAVLQSVTDGLQPALHKRTSTWWCLYCLHIYVLSALVILYFVVDCIRSAGIFDSCMLHLF